MRVWYVIAYEIRIDCPTAKMGVFIRHVEGDYVQKMPFFRKQDVTEQGCEPFANVFRVGMRFLLPSNVNKRIPIGSSRVPLLPSH